MTRKEGFIEVDKMLQEIGVDTTSMDSILDNPSVHVIDYIPGYQVHFSFPYYNETYFFKTDIYPNCSPYNELFIEELAKDFDIDCVDYDLAILGNYKGVISKNYKKENATYTLGERILGKFKEYYDSNLDNDLIKMCISTQNSLDDIWDKLESSYPNQRETVIRLMRKIIDIYLFDIITCQSDRHSRNWEIMEYENNVEIAPLFDNERILTSNSENNLLRLIIAADNEVDEENGDFESILESIKGFQKVSSSEFTDTIKDKLWIISEENLYKVFERIEKKTGYPMPEERKEFYISNYKEHKKRLEEILVSEETKKR